MSTTTPLPPSPSPPLANYILGFLLIGLAWGFTTPFIRAAARAHVRTPQPPGTAAWKKSLWGVLDLLRDWRYGVPLLVNLTGSIWFFLLVGQAELSLTVPITNSLAFLCTVLGEWWVEGKVVGGRTWVGMGLSLLGIGLCVQSKL